MTDIFSLKQPKRDRKVRNWGKHSLKSNFAAICTTKNMYIQRIKKKIMKETEAIESRVNPTSNKPANTAYWQGFE